MNTTKPEYLDIERLLAALRRRWWVIAVCCVVAAAAAFALSEHEAKSYTATASILFQDQSLSQEEAGLTATQNTASNDPTVMATNIQLLTQDSAVARTTAAIVGHGLTTSAVSQAVNVSQQGETDIATVSATSTDPVLAADIANTYVNRFIVQQRAQQQSSVTQALDLVQAQIRALSPQQLAGTTGQALLDRAESLRVLDRLQNGGAQVVTAARTPSGASAPRVMRNTIVGLLLGLILGVTLAFLLERLDRRLKTVEDVEQAYQLPLLGTIPISASYRTRWTSPGSPHRVRDGGAFQVLRTYLRYFNVDHELRSLLVVSAGSGEGKSTIARNLAQAAQESGTKTLLIEADLRRPTAAAHFGLPPEPGLSESLVANQHNAVRHVPIATGVPGRRSDVALSVLPAGGVPPNPAELIESDRMGQLLARASQQYEFVVIDTSPLLLVPDAIPLLAKVDGVLIVSRVGKQTHAAAARLRERLIAVEAPLLGVVANGVTARGRIEYGYSSGYNGYNRDDAVITDDATVA